MIEVSIRELLPRFLMEDRTGRAMAKAVERALLLAEQAVAQGVDNVLNVDGMPEWRLDEMARELHVLYDYRADIEAKRKWIAGAAGMYRIYGTPEAVLKYIRGMFDDAEIEEWPDYGGQPYHYRINVYGQWTNSKKSWVKKAAETAQNLRSVLDDIGVKSEGTLHIAYSGERYAAVIHKCGEVICGAGTLP